MMSIKFDLAVNRGGSFIQNKRLNIACLIVSDRDYSAFFNKFVFLATDRIFKLEFIHSVSFLGDRR